MANTITGINNDIISMSVLEALTAKLFAVSGFSTSFSNEAGNRTEKISVPRTIAADAALTKTTHTDYTIQDADSDAVEITLGEPTYVSWGLDDVEMSLSPVLSLELYGQQKGFALANAVLAAFLDDITNGNYPTPAWTGAAAAFDTTVITGPTGIKQACDAANMPRDLRTLVLQDEYYNALIADTNLVSAAAYGGAEVIRQGAIAGLFGFSKVISCNAIPTNGENLVGFVAHPVGMVVAMRYLQPQDGNTYDRAEAITDPDTGITIGVRDWYDNDSGVRKRVFECVHGNAVGIAAGIKRITSA